MPSPMAAFAPAASGATASPGGNKPALQEGAKDGAKPAFDDMVRRPAPRDDAPVRKPAQRDAEPRDIPSGEARRLRCQDDATDTTAAEDDGQQDDAAPIALLALLDLAPSAVPASVSVPAAGTAVPVDALATPLPGSAASTPFTPATDAVLGQGSARLTPPDTLLTAPDATSPPATPVADAPAKAPLQNLLSFATHLATGQVAAALPEVVTLGRDIVEAFHGDDAEGTTPTGNLLAGVGASNASLGLARTETVNAMAAPSADLHGGHFDEDIGDAVRWMADQKIGHAHIKVTPNDLGTVEIRLRLDGDRVHADFTSAQAEVRQALESSLPRLRDLLGQHGFQLAHADVGHQHAPPSQGGSARTSEDRGDGAEPTVETPRAVRMTARGLVDAYA
ncbi:flagellar hook-length control protein FliK [Pseudoxanthomonas mexicana]